MDAAEGFEKGIQSGRSLRKLKGKKKPEWVSGFCVLFRMVNRSLVVHPNRVVAECRRARSPEHRWPFAQQQ